MTAPTAKRVHPAMPTAKVIIGFAGKLDYRAALPVAERAAVKFPDFRLPSPEGSPNPTFAEMAAWFRIKIAEQSLATDDGLIPPAESVAPVAKPARKTAAKKATPVKATPVKAPEPAETVPLITLRLVHDGVKQTRLYGTEKGSPAQLAIGSAKAPKTGLGWRFWSPDESFYIQGSAGFAPNWAKINEAVTRLESLRSDTGEQLYTVKLEITAVTADGEDLPVKMTKAERDAYQKTQFTAEWQRQYNAASNLAIWDLGMGTATCIGCGATGLGEKTGRISKDANRLPVVECHTCGGFSAPEPVAVIVPKSVVDLSGVLALAATAEPTPESAECPLCRQMLPLTADGKLPLHTALYRSGACRGRLGVIVVDVEAEPATAEPVKATTRKATPVKALPAPGDTALVDATGHVVQFALQSGMSGTARNATATKVRQALNTKITEGRAFKGVKIETRRDKENHRLVMTVTAGGGLFTLAELTDAVAAAVKSVRGVGNRVNK
jgi:hypothetical protein